ncbi:MAG: MMPL family transporter, partial [Candidatus Latescibacterota bacterium]|nr:MMPL family transporter [Candidatus Latescibacterota bacterium]
DELKETRSPAIVLTENRQQAMAVVAEVKRVMAVRGDSSTIRSVKSVYSFLPDSQHQKLAIIVNLRQVLDENEDLLDEGDRTRADSLRGFLDVHELALEDLPEDLTKSFSSKEGKILNFVQINAAVPLRDGRNAIAFAGEVKVIQAADGNTYYASSAHIIFAEMLELMLDDAVQAVALTLLVVGIVLLIDLRNVLSVTLVLTPLLTALAWVTGFMYVFDFKVNIYNIVAFPTIIGMGIDNAVHVFHRYREAGVGSLRLVLRTTGMALLATTLTTMVGFAGLVPAHHPALYWIGIVSLLGLGSCFVTAVTLLPALLQLREGRAGN